MIPSFWSPNSFRIIFFLNKYIPIERVIIYICRLITSKIIYDCFSNIILQIRIKHCVKNWDKASLPSACMLTTKGCQLLDKNNEVNSILKKLGMTESLQNL
jgi:hypothetical protein